MDIRVVLEISAVAALISTAVSYLTFRRSSSLTYVTQERKEWREAIRRIAEELEGCTYKKRKQVLVQLKTRINAYGWDTTNKIEDANIWRQIQVLETCRKEEYEEQKQRMILYLSALLKYDWERSKKEVYGEPMRVVGYAFAVGASIFLAFGFVQLNGDNGAGVAAIICQMLLLVVGSLFLLSLGKKMAKRHAIWESVLYSVIPLIFLIAVAFMLHKDNSVIVHNSYYEAAFIAALFSWEIHFVVDVYEILEKIRYIMLIDDIYGHKNKTIRRWHILKHDKHSNSHLFSWVNWLLIVSVLTVPQITLALCMKYGISENIGTADKLSLHIATGSLSVTIIIALLVYWLQKSDNNKEQLHRQHAAKTAMRYAIENGIRWMIGIDDGMLGSAANIKETANQYRQELLDVLTEQEYNEMILVVEGINDAIAASRDEDVVAYVTEDNRTRMFRPWINTIRLSRYHSYLAMAENYHDLLSEMMIHLLHALGGTCIFEQKMRIYDKNQKTLLELSGEKITIHSGEDLVLEGTFRVDETTYTAQFFDGWVKNDEYVGYYAEGERNGQGCSYGITGEKLKEGIWKKGELQTGVEYSCLIHVDQGELIYNAEENDYDSSDDLDYSVYEQYGMNIIPFMDSETYIVHARLNGFYVADLKIENDMWQPDNIQTLEQYLVKKNPGRLTELKKMIEL